MQEEQSYRKAIELDPRNADARFWLGGMLKDKGDIEGAERSYRRVIELDPKDAIAQVFLGGIF